MQSHPEICARFEILSRFPDSWEDQLHCLTTLFETKRYPHIKALGFKCKVSRVVDREAFATYLHERGFRIIHLVRENQLKFIVSVIRARYLRAEHGRSNLLESGQDATGPITIPEPVFARAKKRLVVAKRLQMFVDCLELPKLQLTYEQLFDNIHTSLNHVWNFLDVQPFDTIASPRKNTPDDIRKVVKNLDELLEHHPEMAQYLD